MFFSTPTQPTLTTLSLAQHTQGTILLIYWVAPAVSTVSEPITRDIPVSWVDPGQAHTKATLLTPPPQLDRGEKIKQKGHGLR